ncbi:MAG: Type II restriction enzyme HaeII [bacterium P201]|nr:MAG: Type II restriction enzyme HaeII [bacterium P201]
MKKDVLEAKQALDSIIKKSRVHLYKPIQIGEILYHYRVKHDVDLDDLESYRTKSKKWRDEVTTVLVGRTSTSSAKYQDNLFDENAMPPRLIKILALENVRTRGAVEAYIYSKFTNKHSQLAEALSICNNATKNDFNVKSFIDSFWDEPGLKRSLDKIYEIIVFSLFSTLVERLNLQVEVSVDSAKLDILSDFQDFAKMVMCIDINVQKSSKQRAKVYRVGVTNAADRGLDMYSNWGPAIQIKHLSLDVELAQSIVTSISSDRIVIVCKDAEKDVILSLLNQIGWRSRIQSIVTEDDLVRWYEKALRGSHAELLGDTLLETMRKELANEFPSIDETPEIIKRRRYETIKNVEWKESGI